MGSYTVTTDRLAGFAEGDTVTDDDLAGNNVDALVEAGHLQPTGDSNAAPTTREIPAPTGNEVIGETE